MKKLLIATLALCAMTTGICQTTKTTLDVPISALYGRDSSNWRGGYSPTLSSVSYSDTLGNESILATRALVYTNLDKVNDHDPFRDLYLGLGLSGSIVAKKNFEFGFLIGYTANFSDLQNIKDGELGFGGYIRLKW